MKKVEWLAFIKEKYGSIPQRYLMTILSFFGVVLIYTLRNTLTMAILNSKYYMKCHNIANQTNDPLVSNVFKTKVHVWTLYFYCGYVLAHLPGAYLARRFGGKYIFGLTVLLSCICSMLHPTAACYSSVLNIISSVSMGIVEGPMFPSLTELLSQWAPPFERTLLASTIFAGVQIGTIISITVTGFMLEHMELSHVFYILGGIGGVWFVLWTLLCYSKPSQHPFISSKELDYLKEQIPEQHKNMSTPWMAMLTSKPLWALTLAEMGHDYGLFTMTTELPQYYCDILGFPFSRDGDMCSLPYLIMWLVSVLLGYTCDKILALKWTTTTQLRRILATLGGVVPSIGMVIASFITDPGTFNGVMVVSLGLMGCSYCSLRVNPLDLSPNHASTVMAIINGAGAISGTLSPTTISAFLTNEVACSNTNSPQNRDERRKAWQNVFWIMFAVVVISNFPFVNFGSGEVQPWDKPEDIPSRSDLRRRSTISGGDPIREKYRYHYPEQPAIKE